MEPVALGPDHVAPVAGGAVSLSFDLPRFGISLFELAPSKGSGYDAHPPSASCSYRLDTAPRSPLPVLLVLSLAGALTHRRRFAQRERRGSQQRLSWRYSQ
jgi:hypothetical protein